jgi:hypothetical protein
MASRTFCDKCGVQAGVRKYHFGTAQEFGRQPGIEYEVELCRDCADAVMKEVGAWMGEAIKPVKELAGAVRAVSESLDVIGSELRELGKGACGMGALELIAKMIGDVAVALSKRGGEG